MMHLKTTFTNLTVELRENAAWHRSSVCVCGVINPAVPGSNHNTGGFFPSGVAALIDRSTLLREIEQLNS